MKKLLIAALLMAPMPSVAVWDTSTPAGTEAKSLGDDRIRELKMDIQTSLRHEGDFPGPDTSNPRFIYTPSTGTTAQRPSGSTNTAAGMLFVNKTSGTVEQYNGTEWEAIAFSTNFIPSGTKLLFVQNSCPNGWTIDTNFEGFAIRTTSTPANGATTSGTVDISSSIAHTHNLSTHTHTMGNHTHTTPTHTHDLEHTDTNAVAFPNGFEISSTRVSGSAMYAADLTGTGNDTWSFNNRTETSGSGTSGTPSTNTTDPNVTQITSENTLNLKHLNVIVCTKN